jgi:hypothetical protein
MIIAAEAVLLDAGDHSLAVVAVLVLVAVATAAGVTVAAVLV